jgi:hypothetical protein
VAQEVTSHADLLEWAAQTSVARRKCAAHLSESVVVQF